MTPRLRLPAAAAALVLLVLPAACGGTASGARPGGPTVGSSVGPAARVVDVVAAEDPWGELARQIGGTLVRVTSILRDPTVDPHSYQSDPRTAAAIGGAALVIVNGLGYDDFAGRLLDADPRPGRQVLTVATAAGVTGAEANPHLWYSPPAVAAAARGVTDRLVALDPADAAGFRTRLASFTASYQRYVDTVAAIRTRHPGAPVAYTERVPGYLVEAAGLHLATPASFAQAVEDGSDPSPADTAAVDAALTDHRVAVLLYNAQVTSPATTRVRDTAQARGVPVVGVTETLPAGVPDLPTWQADQAAALLAALGG